MAATTYEFQVSLPVTDTLPRNRFVNVLHFEHQIGGQSDEQLDSMCQDIVELYQNHYGANYREVQCKAYDTGDKPNYPRADVIVNQGVPWNQSVPREIALCLSWAGPQRGIKHQRGRMYLAPFIREPLWSAGLRPTQAQLDWAIGWYIDSNNSLPDIGGVDWKFGTWSRTYRQFMQSQQAWCNDDWDIQRRRGLRETTRISAQREG